MPEKDKYDFSDIVEQKTPASTGGNYNFSDIVEEKSKKKAQSSDGSTPSAGGTATGTKTYKSPLEGIKGSPPDHASPDDLIKAYGEANKPKSKFVLPNATLNTGDKSGNTGVVMPPPPDTDKVQPVNAGQYAVEQFNKKYGTDYTVGQMTGKEKVPVPLPALEAAGKNILATSDKVFAAALKLPMNATRIVANPLIALAGLKTGFPVSDEQKKDMLDSFEDQDARTRALKLIADHYEREGDKLSEEISGNMNMKPKNFMEAANKYGTHIAGFLPYIMALPVAGEAGGTGLMISEQRNANENNPNMGEGQKDLNATLKGMVMGVAVPFASKMFSSNFGNLVEKVGMSEAKATVAKSTQEAITSALKPYTPLTKPLVGAATGIGIELGNHFADKLTNPDYKGDDLGERLFESAMTFGLFQAAGVASGGIYHGARSKIAQIKLKKAQEKIDGLDKNLENTELSEVAKESIEAERQKEMTGINDVIQKEESQVDNLMPEHKAQVIRLTNEAAALDGDLAKLDSSDPTVKILEDKQAQSEYPLTKEQAKTLTTKTRKELEDLGYDAIIISPKENPKQEIVVFSPDQVEIIATYKEGLRDNSVKKLIKGEKEPDNSQKIDALKEQKEQAKTKAKKEEIQEEIDELENQVGITHAETKAARKELGIPEYEKSVKTQKELEAEADKKLKGGYDINKLLTKLDNGELPTDVEQEIMKNYLAGLRAKIEKSPTDELIEQARRAIEASDKMGGSEVARSLAARRGLKPKDETLMDYFMHEMDVNEGAPLTDAQKETVKKEYADITKARDELQAKVDKLQEENDRLKAEAAVRKSKAKSEKSKTKRTHEEHVADRQKIVEDMKSKLAKLRNEAQSAIIPYARELVVVAPDVAKLVHDYVSEGVEKLDDIVKGVHEQIKDAIPDITERDVKALIAGEYNEKKLTRNEIAEKVFDLKHEAKLILKLEALQAGKEPTSEQKKIQRNQEIANLSKEIKEHDLSKLAAYKKRVQGQIEKLEEELKQPVINDKEDVAPLKLDKEATELKDKYVKLKLQRQQRLQKQQYQNRTKYEKAKEAVLNVANVPRTIMSSMDFSAPLRQALVATTAHPVVASKAFGEMFKQAVSQKRFDRWFHDVKEDPRYATAEKSGLYMADPHDPRLSEKEEAFMNNLAEKIPAIGPLIKGSERAYVGYLNKMRWDLFNQFSEEYQKQGKTPENSPELYKGLASYVNNSTGRGKLGPLEKSAPVLNSIVFSPRLMASRLNFLNPAYYAKLPKEVRVQALKDVSKTIALGMSVLALAKLNGAEVEDDPRSTDFGKIKVGNTRWDIWGGYQQYIRVLTQMMTGETKSSTTGKMSTLDGKGAFGRTRGDVMEAFIRGKLSPLAGVGADLLSGRTVTGEEVTLMKELESHMLPLLYSDVKEAMKEQGVKGLFTAGVPAMFGVGVSTYSPRNDKYKK